MGANRKDKNGDQGDVDRLAIIEGETKEKRKKRLNREKARRHRCRHLGQNAENACKWRENNPEKAKEQNRKWKKNNIEKERERGRIRRKNNIEKERERNRKWKENNPEKVKEQNCKWRENNPEKAIESYRKWRENNPEKARESERKWRENNPEKVRENHRKWIENNRDYINNHLRLKRNQKKLLQLTVCMDIVSKESLNKYRGPHAADRLAQRFDLHPSDSMEFHRVINRMRADGERVNDKIGLVIDERVQFGVIFMDKIEWDDIEHKDRYGIKWGERYILAIAEDGIEDIKTFWELKDYQKKILDEKYESYMARH